ncbi:MAG: LysM domain-containing protein [Microbacterium pygmaeum]
MRTSPDRGATAYRRALAGSIPAAVAGSLTLLLSATPAHAGQASVAGTHDAIGERMLRIPASVGPSPAVLGPRAVALRVPTEASSGYTVVAGDTITSIAAAHGTTVDAVFAANGLSWSSIIYPGQTIAIPGASAPAEAITAPAAPPAESAAPVTAGGSHTVSAGDTISSIAAAYGQSVDAVLTANALSWSSIIYPGEVLMIPGAPSFELAASQAPAPPASDPLDAEQIGNAELIIAVGRELGVPDRGIAIALGTAMQESWLRNLDWGDRDSLGLFQQRPSTGWGTEDEVRDPIRSTRAFFGGASDPNGYSTLGLLDIPGWESMSFADAAQAVQISAYPDRYAAWEQPAYAWLAAHG